MYNRKRQIEREEERERDREKNSSELKTSARCSICVTERGCGYTKDGKVLNELEHANVSCTFHCLVPEQKQKREEQDTLDIYLKFASPCIIIHFK